MLPKYYPVLLLIVFFGSCTPTDSQPILVTEGFTVDSSLDNIQFSPVSHPYRQDEGDRADFVRQYKFEGYNHSETMDFITTSFYLEHSFPSSLCIWIHVDNQDRMSCEIKFNGSYIDYQCGYNFSDTATVMSFHGRTFVKKYPDETILSSDSSSLTINRIPSFNQTDTLIGQVYMQKQFDDGREVSYSGTFRVVIYPERWGFDAKKTD